MATSYLGTIVETVKPIRVASRSLGSKDYQVHYISDTKLKAAGFNLFGYVYKGKIYLRTNLPNKVERALFRHEVYHVEDKHKWLGKYGREIRANAHTAMHDPIGFLATLVYSLNAGRIKTYWRLYVYPRNLN
jgi:hypothetical protein